MNALVSYGSSDEEEEGEDVQPDQRLETVKTDIDAPPPYANHARVLPLHQDPEAAQHEAHGEGQEPIGPAWPSAATAQITAELPEDTSSAPSSPYAWERQRLRELTMPTVPNFDIPDSPPPPRTNSEEAAVLAATTKKFQRFLDLKKQGVHFNERLQNSSSLRNPSLLSKLMEFADISHKESYKSSLSEGIAASTEWPEECHVEGLMRQNERREKKRAVARERVDFVPGTSVAATSAGGGDGQKKSKFNQT